MSFHNWLVLLNVNFNYFRALTWRVLFHGKNQLGLTLQTWYVIKRSGISVKSYGVTRWVRRIWKIKRKVLGLQLRKMFCLLKKKSKLSISNKLNLYKVILKPIWTYGIQLWGTVAQSNKDILQRFQSKVLRSIVNVLWYITNVQLHRELSINRVKEEIFHKSSTIQNT